MPWLLGCSALRAEDALRPAKRELGFAGLGQALRAHLVTQIGFTGGNNDTSVTKRQVNSALHAIRQNMIHTNISIALEGHKILDADLTLDERWVGVTDKYAIIDYAPVRLPFRTIHPNIRSIEGQRVLVYNSRTDNNKINAAIIGLNTETVEFFAGDAIADVIITEDFIVFTYFDEALGSTDVAGQGASVFDKSGRFLYGLRDTFQIDIADCYCATASKPNLLAIFSYPTFQLELIDLYNKKHRSYPVPESVYGALAISEIARDYIFCVRKGLTNSFYRWHLESATAEIINEIEIQGPVRGLRSGRFITMNESSIIEYRAY